MTPIKRMPRREDAFLVPRPLPDLGRFEVDGTWGSIQPIELAPGVRTIGELDVIAQIEAGGPLVDSRQAHFHRDGTIPTARGIPHPEVVERIDELDGSRATVFFCNGPQCTATPSAVRSLLESGYPAEAILYYRGGMHDWMTLALPVVVPVPGGG